MKIAEHFSPNFDDRKGASVDMLVLHYTGMPTAQEALEKLCNSNGTGRVSAHYLVNEDGSIIRLVPEDKRAWHAGVSYWRGATDINARSIGIEIANPGDQPFPPAQMQAVAELCRDITARQRIPSWNVVAHSDVAPERKADPGELFDWKWLAEQGVGMWPEKTPATAGLLVDPVGWVMRVLRQGIAAFTPFSGSAADVRSMQKGLGQFGYDIAPTGAYDDKTKQMVTAFQRHFRPAQVNGQWDEDCRQLLNGLLARTPSATVAAPDGRMAAL